MSTLKNVSSSTEGFLKQDIPYVQRGEEVLHLDIYRPAGIGPFPVVLVMHGGGWSSGHKGGDTQPLCEALCQANFVIVAPNYRLAPAHRWPACLDDVSQALAWTKAHIAQFDGDPQSVVLLGYSAGGHLACLTAMQNEVAVKAVAALAAPTDLVADTQRRGGLSPSLQALLDAEELSPEVEQQLAAMSPLNTIREGLPPFLLLHGTADQSVPFAQSLAFQDRLCAAGVSCELRALDGAPHRLSQWGEFDSNYLKKMAAWLHQTLVETAS